MIILDLKNISIYFSGHNISEYADIAIRSFTLHYPELVDNIYYFDDYSTDDTANVLTELGIHRFSWDVNLKTHFDTLLTNGVISTGGQCQMMRCEFIFKSILKHCTSQYCLVLDGDTVTLRNGFIEEYIRNGNAVNGVYGFMHTDVRGLKTLPDNPRHNEFSILKESDEVVHSKDLDYSFIKHLRFHPYHIFVDMHQLKNADWLFNNLYSNDYANLFKDQMIDVGSDLLLHCMNNELPYSLAKEDTAIHHWIWVSSSIRDINYSCIFTKEYVVGRLVKGMKNKPSLRKVLDKLEVKPHKLFKALTIKVRTSEYN